MMLSTEMRVSPYLCSKRIPEPDLVPGQESDSDARHAQIAAYLRGLNDTEKHNKGQMHVEHEPRDEPVSDKEDSQMLCDSLREWTRIFHKPT
jgi:hypothetical protein